VYLPVFATVSLHDVPVPVYQRPHFQRLTFQDDASLSLYYVYWLAFAGLTRLEHAFVFIYLFILPQ
jgi:hypothetical protein